MPPRSTCSATSPAGSATPGCSSWRRPRRGRRGRGAARRPRHARPARRPAPLRRRRPGRRLGPGRPRRAGDGPHGRAPAERRRVPAGARPGRHRRPGVAGRRGAGPGRPPRRGRPRRGRGRRRAAPPDRPGRSWPPSSSPPSVATARECEELVRLRCSCAAATTTSSPTTSSRSACTPRCRRRSRSRLHRRAADLTSDRPEVMAEHAYAAGDEPRAAHGWLLAGEDALRRAAVEDALGLLRPVPRRAGPPSPGRGPVPCWRAVRSTRRARTSRPRWTTSTRRWPWPATPTTGGSRWPRSASRAATRPWGSVSPSTSCVAPLELGLRLAADLGDRRAEADFTSRLAILEASRLRLATALARAEGGLVRARSAGSEDAQVLALDGLKTVWAYLGDPVRLRRGDRRARAAAPGPARATWLLQWTVFEKSFVPAAEGRLDDARAAGRRGAGAQPRSAATRRTPATCTPTTAGSPGWPATWTTARRVGREAVEASSPIDHPWWYAIAAGLLAATLIETGDARRGRGRRPARAGDRRGRRRPAAGCAAWPRSRP